MNINIPLSSSTQQSHLCTRASDLLREDRQTLQTERQNSFNNWNAYSSNHISNNSSSLLSTKSFTRKDAHEECLERFQRVFHLLSPKDCEEIQTNQEESLSTSEQKLNAELTDQYLANGICTFRNPIKDFFHLTELCRINPKNAFAHAILGELFRKEKNDNDRAYFHYKLSCELCPQNSLALSRLALLYREGGNHFPKDLNKAFKLSQEALLYDRQNVFAHLTIASCYLSGEGVNKNSKEASNHLFSILEIDPNNVFAHTELAIYYLYGESGDSADIERAFYHLNKAHDLSPNHFLIHLLLSDVYLKGSQTIPKDCLRAKSHLLHAYQLNPNSALINARLGKLYVYGNDDIPVDLSKALYYLNKAIQLEPSYYLTYTLLGTIYSNGGNGIPKDYSKAIAYYEKASELYPNHATAHIELCNIYLTVEEHKSPEKAYAHFTQAFLDKEYRSMIPSKITTIEEECVSDDNNGSAYAFLGAIYLNGKGVPKDIITAESYLIRACNLDSSNDFALSTLGTLYLRGGGGVNQDLREAFLHFIRAYQINPHNGYVRAILGELYWRLFKDSKAALYHLSHACAIEPTSAFNYIEQSRQPLP